MAAMFIGAASLSYAQIIDTIEVNARTGQAKTRIPFDRAFMLKVPYPEKPLFVDYVTQRKVRRFQDAFELAMKKKKGLELNTLPQAHVNYEKQGAKGFVFLRFDQWPYQDDPTGKTFDLVDPAQNLVLMFPSVDPRGYEVLKLQHRGNAAGAAALLATITSEQRTKYGVPFLLPEESDLGPIVDLVDVDLRAIKVKEDLIATNNATLFDLRGSTSIDALIRLALTDTMTGQRVCAGDCDIIKAFLALREMDDTAYPMLMDGQRTILEPVIKLKHAERMANVKSTDEMLTRMVAFQRAAEVITGAKLADQQLPDLLALVRANRTWFAEIDERKEAVNQTIYKESALAFLSVAQFDASTTYYSMASRAGFRAIPDFGLIVYGFQKDFIRPAPYLGVQLNFRQVDKEIPLHQYPRHKFTHRFSLGLGYTLMSLAEESKREDFFEKGAFMTGFGIRLSNALRITGGALWFYKNDPNPVLDGRSIACVPYMGLSVDLELRNLLNTLDKLTFSKP